MADGGEFGMRAWVGVFGEHTAVGRQRQHDFAQRAVSADGDRLQHGWLNTRLPEV